VGHCWRPWHPTLSTPHGCRAVEASLRVKLAAPAMGIPRGRRHTGAMIKATVVIKCRDGRRLAVRFAGASAKLSPATNYGCRAFACAGTVWDEVHEQCTRWSREATPFPQPSPACRSSRSSSLRS
jgi:hypothetical protein